jgi:site-specific DNA-methyltransferase (adenine-specific)
MRQLPDHCIDMVVCDLPYGTTNNPWDELINLEQLWDCYRRIVKPAGVIALTAAGVFTAKLIMSNTKLFKYKIVWIKSKPTNFLNVKKQPLRRHEDICIFYNKQPIYVPQMLPGEPYDRGMRKSVASGCYGKFSDSVIKSSGNRYPYDIVFFEDDWFYCKTAETEDQPPVHPTQKPVELGSYLIRTYTKPGDVVLDNACGSGSFPVAAIRESRQFIGIEKNQGVFYRKHHPIDMVSYCNQRIQKEISKLSQKQ